MAADAAAAAAVGTPQSLAQDLLPLGTVVHRRWEVGQRIGAGGFGQVFFGRDMANPAATRVAIKVEPYCKDKVLFMRGVGLAVNKPFKRNAAA
jgi:hypothetical protein